MDVSLCYEANSTTFQIKINYIFILWILLVVQHCHTCVEFR